MTDGLFGNGLFGEEYYSARVQDDAVGPAITATSVMAAAGRRIQRGAAAITAAGAMVMSAATRLRTSAMSILAASAMTASGRKLWEPETDTSPTWTTQSPGSDPWTPSSAGSDPWTPE
jgi:hypothetical protein